MVPTMLVIALERLKNTKLSYLKDLLVQIIADCLYYNPTLTLDILNKNNRTGEALSTWFQMLSLRTKGGKRKHHRREHDKKVCVLGLLALLSAPTESLPAECARRTARSARRSSPSRRSQGADRRAEGDGGERRRERLAARVGRRRRRL